MSTLKIEERIIVPASPARVWAFLLDPARVAACLPGARLDGTEGDRTFLGTMKVKVGPVQMEIKGKATLSEVDEAARRVTMSGTGNDKSGGGSAKMDMKSRIITRDDGTSEIVVEADVDLAGKLVRFGRGMMEGISKQLFKQFSERVRAELASEEEEEQEEAAAPAEEAKSAEKEGAAAPPEDAKREDASPPAEQAKPEAAPPEEAKKEDASPPAEPRAEGATAPPVNEGEAAPAQEEAAAGIVGAQTNVPAPAADEAPEASEPAPADTVSRAGGDNAAPVTAEAPAVANPEPPAPKKAPLARKKAAPPKAAEPEALDAGSLVWAALWAWIKGLFGRIFGRRS